MKKKFSFSSLVFNLNLLYMHVSLVILKAEKILLFFLFSERLCAKDE